MYGDTITMMDAGVVTLFSMTVVFATLWVISFILYGFSIIFKEKPVAVPTEATETEDENLLAVFMAAIHEFERQKRANPTARSIGGSYKSRGDVKADNPIARNCMK